MCILCIDKLYYSMSISCLYIYIYKNDSFQLFGKLSDFLDRYRIPPSSRDTAPMAGVNINVLVSFKWAFSTLKCSHLCFLLSGPKVALCGKGAEKTHLKKMLNKLYKSTSLKTSWQHRVKNSISEVKQCWCSFCWSEISNEFSWTCMNMCSKTSLTFAVHR